MNGPIKIKIETAGPKENSGRCRGQRRQALITEILRAGERALT